MTLGSSLTIVQLTDCHLLADPEGSMNGIVTRPRLRRVIDEIRSRGHHFDVLAVTGDTADGGAVTYEAFRGELEDWTERLRIIPGNHDDRASLMRAFPNACQALGDRTVFVVETADWIVIGLDSQCTGMTAGELGHEQLSWLSGRLEAEPSRAALLFLHHPPILVGSAWLDEIGLQDAEELTALVAAHPQVRVVISGHVHQEASGSIGSATVHTTPAVGPQFRPRIATFEIEPGPPAYRIVELHPAGGWSTTVVRCT